MDKNLAVLHAMSMVTHSTDLDEFMRMANLTSSDVRGALKELSKEGFVTKTGKGYVISERGKLVVVALSPSASEKAFQFYCDVGQPVGVSAKNVKEFYDVVKTIPVNSLEFHLRRTDFENWFTTIVKDDVFARELAGFKQTGLKGEALRDQILLSLQTRYGKDVLDRQWSA